MYNIRSLCLRNKHLPVPVRLLYVQYIPVAVSGKALRTGTGTYIVRTIYQLRLLYVQYMPVAVSGKANYRYRYVYCTHSLPVAASGKAKAFTGTSTGTSTVRTVFSTGCSGEAKQHKKKANYLLYYRF